MQIECPHCQTVFKLTDEQLHIADGMVRCGLCHEVFNALEDNTKPDKETRQTTPAEEKTEPVSLADEPDVYLRSEAREDQTSTASDVSSSKNTITGDREKLAADDLFDGVQSKLIPDEYRIPKYLKPYSMWRDIAWSIAIIALIFSLFVEYSWFNRNQLIKRDELKPWLTQLCNIVDCDTLGLRNTNEIEMLARNIYSHPNTPGALMVSVTLFNHAAFSQPYPHINIDFSDVRGEVIASRVFTPEEYLQLNTSKIKLLRSGLANDFHLEIQDPGPQAMTYEFKFL